MRLSGNGNKVQQGEREDRIERAIRVRQCGRVSLMECDAAAGGSLTQTGRLYENIAEKKPPPLKAEMAQPDWMRGGDDEVSSNCRNFRSGGDIAPRLFALNGVSKVALIPAKDLLRMEPDDRLEYLDRILGLSSES